MPNRILKESICTSESIDGLSWFEEVMFYRLIVNCDDFGRMDARPAVLKARLFPLKERITLKEVSNALTGLADAGIVITYVCDGKPYLYLPTWEVHQTTRAKKSKFPAPADGLQTSASKCMQVHADVPGIRYSDSRIDIRESDSVYIAAQSRGDMPSPVSEIVAYLNEKAGTSYQSKTKATRQHIQARLNEGFTVADFQTVIDKKCREWRGTDMEKYLRPETLFGTKFEGYLNQKGNPGKPLQKDGFQAAMEELLGQEGGEVIDI